MNNLNENVVEKLIGVKAEYITISPNKFKRGHGGGLSVKIVLPCYCQANCTFCFNKDTIMTQEHDYECFFKKLTKSLDMIVNKIKDRPISLDITGNEPTFDIKNFTKFMRILKKYHNKVDKIVLTTNGFHLKECLPELIDVVDIVNISLHHYDFEKRKKIFQTMYIPNDDSLKEIIEELKKHDITCTAVSVLSDEIKEFKEFYNRFITWAMELKFSNVRMRSNFCSENSIVNEAFKLKFKNEKIDELKGLTTKTIIDEKTGFETRILKGVPDLTAYVIGAERVIDDNGLCYIDYNKKYLVNCFNIDYFNNAYILK